MNTRPEARDAVQTSLPTVVPPLDHIHRGMWSHLWSDRSPDNKLSCIANDAARRLHGLADILRTIGLCATTPRHDLGRYSFLAETADDIASALDSAAKAVRAQMNAEDADQLRKKKPKKSGRRATA